MDRVNSPKRAGVRRLGYMALRARAAAKTWWREIRARREAGRAFADIRRPPILIYRMGKVGSRTVVASLRAAAISSPVLSVHFLSDDLKTYRDLRQTRNPPSPIPYHILLGSAVRDQIDKRPGWPCKIVSLVRDPIAFVISNFFQNAANLRAEVVTSEGTIDAEKALPYLTDKFHRLGGSKYVDQWFDRELKRVFGIDVFATPFPVDRGHAVYRCEGVEALVMRLEDLSDKGPHVLAEFFELPRPLKLIRSNSRNRSKDADGYEEVLTRIRLDESACRQIYACRIASHFYSGEMIEQFVTRWTATDHRTPCAA